jgi:hypothetical protein
MIPWPMAKYSLFIGQLIVSFSIKQSQPANKSSYTNAWWFRCEEKFRARPYESRARLTFAFALSYQPKRNTEIQHPPSPCIVCKQSNPMQAIKPQQRVTLQHATIRIRCEWSSRV